MDLTKIKFDPTGLIPAIIQDINTKQILMLGWMNADSIEHSANGLVWLVSQP
jgi:phosphoribosyl-AMP cyclohydrolase